MRETPHYISLNHICNSFCLAELWVDIVNIINIATVGCRNEYGRGHTIVLIYTLGRPYKNKWRKKERKKVTDSPGSHLTSKRISVRRIYFTLPLDSQKISKTLMILRSQCFYFLYFFWFFQNWILYFIAFSLNMKLSTRSKLYSIKKSKCFVFTLTRTNYLFAVHQVKQKKNS